MRTTAEVELQSGLRTRLIPLDPRDEQAEQEWRKDSAVFWQSSQDDLRTTFDRYLRLTPIRKGAQFEKIEGPRIRGWWARPERAAAGRSVLHFHGGGYGLGSAEAYRGFVSQIADRANSSAFILEYPLAPEATVPAAYNLAIEAREWLATQGVTKLAIVGDSAGGGLTLASLAEHTVWGSRMVRSALPVLGCVVFSPWVDLSMSGASAERPDPVLTLEYLQSSATQYLGDIDPQDPRASPLFGVPFGLPPILIQVGSDELLIDDAKRYAAIAGQRGADVTLEIWKGLHHVFQQHTEELVSSRKALDASAKFLLRLFENGHN